MKRCIFFLNLNKIDTPNNPCFILTIAVLSKSVYNLLGANSSLKKCLPQYSVLSWSDFLEIKLCYRFHKTDFPLTFTKLHKGWYGIPNYHARWIIPLDLRWPDIFLPHEYSNFLKVYQNYYFWTLYVLAPDIPKSKTKSENMLSGIDILQWKLILWIKTQ